MRRGPRYKIGTDHHLLRDIFERQKTLGLSDDRLSARIGMSKPKISHLRNPGHNNGKDPSWGELTRLASGVGLTIYARTFLAPDRAPNPLSWISSVREVG